MAETLAFPKIEEIIFKVFSSFNTNPIEIDLEKNFLEFDYIITNFRLYKSPLRET